MKEKQTKKYIVYVTKNTVNGIEYIGVHKTLNPDIFDSYLGCGVYSNRPSSYYMPVTPFQQAVKKYGPSKFIRSTIKVFDNKEDAYKLEGELVTWDVVYSDRYYNAIIGGIITDNEWEEIYQYNLDGTYLREWDLEEASEFYSTTTDALVIAVKHKHRNSGFYWSRNKVDKINLEEYSNPNVPKKIYKYSEQGVCVGIYESLHEFDQPGRVCTAIQTQKLYKDHYYSYTLYEKFVPKTVKTSLKDQLVYIYDKNGKYFGEAVGPKKILELIGGKSRESLYNAISLNKPYKGFQFSFTKVDQLEKASNVIEKKPVIVYDIYGSPLKEYSSINEAVKDLHIDNSSAHRVLKGTQRQTKGYILKYKKVV